MMTNVLLLSRIMLPYFLVFLTKTKAIQALSSALVSLRRDIRFKVYGSSLKASFSKLYNKLKN